MRQRWGIIAVVAGLAFLSGGWLMQQGASSGTNVYQQARLFDDVLAHVSEYYVDSIGEAQLYRKATEGLLSELHDPYIPFSWPTRPSGNSPRRPPATTAASVSR